MKKSPSFKPRRTAIIVVFSSSLTLTTLFFNNCSKGYVSGASSVTGSSGLASTAPGSDLPSTEMPNSPAQPSPLPVLPISVTNNPSWMSGHSLNEWIEIPNTAGAGGTSIEAFSGMALRESTSEIIIGAAGGHGDGGDNRVVSMVLATNQPKWIQRIGPSAYMERDVSHYKDGTPSARHTYQSTYYVESLDRLFLFGAEYTYGNAYTFPTVDAFSFKTNQWDPPNTWAPLPVGAGYGAGKVPGSDDIFLRSLTKWSAAKALAAYKAGNPSTTDVWSTPITQRTAVNLHYPLSYDKKRNQLFNLQFGDGLGYDAPVVWSSVVNLNTGVQSDVKIKPSAALDLFKNEMPVYASMDYDPDNDRFLFYSGQGVAAGRVYVITPSSTSLEWDMTLLKTIANSPNPPASTPAGLNSNFKYVPALKGFVLLAARGQNIFFLKTAP